MKRYHPVIAIIFANIVISILANLLPDIPLSDILMIFLLVFGGFIATYISRTNKAIIGLYEGILYSISILIMIFISKSELTLIIALFLVLTPILGLIGGFIAKTLRPHLENENN